MTATALHLLCPGLLGPLPHEAVDLVDVGEPGEALALLLARGRRVRHASGTDPDRRRFELFGLEPPTAKDLPVGPLSFLGDGGDPGMNWYFRADPVHLRADRDRLLVLDPGRLVLPSEQVEGLIREFNSLFAEDGLHLEAPHPNRWYLRVDHVPALSTTPLNEAMNRPMGESLPSGEDARPWMAHLNAMQMLLHASALNRQRETEGRLPITGIWPWGGGQLPAAPGTADWTRVYSDVALVKGLARHLGVDHAPVVEPQDLLDQFAADHVAGPVLVDAGSFPVVQDGESFQDWESALNAFAVEWASPLLEALRRGRLQRLVIDLGSCRWELTPSMLRRFWRRRKPLKQWLERSQS